MKAHWIPISFVAGMGAGWLIFGGGMPASAAAAENKSATPAESVVRKREARPATTPHEAKFRIFAKEFPTLSREDRATFQKSLTPGDRTAAIEAMLTQVGPDGISWDAKSMIGDVLTTWAGEDFDAAWVWCQRIESDANRNFVASKLLDGLMNKDPDHAFALHLEMVAEDPEFNSSIPLTFLQKAATQGTASFLDLFGKLPFRRGSTGTAMDFAADFDFQQVADSYTALSKNNEGKSPPAFPTNFLSSWAAQDADAAYAWYAKNERCPFETFGSFLDGIEKQGLPGSSYAWAADKLSVPGTDRDAMIRTITQDSSDRKASIINSIAHAMQDADSRDQFLGDVITTCNFSDPVASFGFTLNQMSTPAVRLETLQRVAKDSRFDSSKIPDAQLQQWGLTRQQVEQIHSSIK